MDFNIFCIQNDCTPRAVSLSIPAHFFRICREYYWSNMLTQTGIWIWNTVSQKPLGTLQKHWAGRTRRWETLVHHVSSNSAHWTEVTQKDASHPKTFQSSYPVRTVILLHWLTVAQLQKNVPFQQRIFCLWSQLRDSPCFFSNLIHSRHYKAEN